VRTLRTAGLGIVIGLIVAACSGGGTVPPASTEAPSAAPPTGGAGAVTVVDFAFQPSDLTVAAGSTVTWTDSGDATHTVKWSDGTPETAGLAKGATYQRTFETAGAYPYVCGIHGSMTGTITVTE
jgi:plastocyanin